MSSPTKSLVDSVKSKIVSSPISMSPSTPQEEVGITHLKEQLRECRSRIKSDKDHIENMEIKLKYFEEKFIDMKYFFEQLLIKNAEQKNEIEILEKQLSELKFGLELKYKTTLEQLEKCGVIKNPASQVIQKPISKNTAMDELDQLIRELQSDITNN
jgi:chromosome segregation ATPase